jgi:hypothetical protein
MEAQRQNLGMRLEIAFVRLAAAVINRMCWRRFLNLERLRQRYELVGTITLTLTTPLR